MTFRLTNRALARTVMLFGAVGLCIDQTPTYAKANVAEALTQTAGDKAIVARYIVTFPEPGTLHYLGGLPGLDATAPEKTGAGKFDAQNKAVMAYRSYLNKAQNQSIEKITSLVGHELKIHHAYDLIESAIAVELSAEEAHHIGAGLGLPIRSDTDYAPDTFRGPSYTGADSVWSGIHTPDHIAHSGIGITIGVIDTGYSPAHPAFGVMPPICNGDRYGPFLKVTSAVDCTLSSRGTCTSAALGGNPIDREGHGTHTASTAAGNALTSSLINTETTISVAPTPLIPIGFTQMSGVAPCANLRIYKICDIHCTGSDVQAAQEAAITDRVDVLNFSITDGGDGPWVMGGSERGFLDAFNAGIITTTTAGNVASGADPIGSIYHLAPWLLTIAATSHDQAVVLPGRLSVTGPGIPPSNTQNIVLTPSDTPRITDTLTHIPLLDLPENPSGCDHGRLPPPGYFSGGIALLSSGACSNIEQANMAYAAGAITVLIHASISGSESIYLDHAMPVVPIYSISATDGRVLVNYLNAHDHRIVVNIDPPTRRGDVLADYSQRGPNYFFDVTKPDIAAPGTQIYAAYTASYRPHDPTIPNNYAYLSGTSMAAPHVAGAAALVREVHPNWSPAEVMSALRLTAYEGGTQENGITPWNPDDVGNGRVDLNKATLAGLVMDESYAHFRDADPTSGGDPRTLNLPAVRNSQCTTACTWTRTVRNGLSRESSWTVTLFDAPNAAISVSPMTFTLAPRGTPGDAQILTITARPTTSGGALGFGEISFRSTSDSEMPSEHITVAVQSPRP